MTGRRLPKKREIAVMLSLFFRGNPDRAEMLYLNFGVVHIQVWHFFSKNFRNILSVEILDGRINFVDNEYIVLSMGYLADEAVR